MHPKAADEGPGVLGSDQHPAIDAVYVSVRADIVRVGTDHKRYVVFVDTHLGPVQCS
jgi:hypothetical protein